MSTKPLAKGFQDMPPKGGYPNVPLKRGIGPRGPSGIMIWCAILSMTTYGFYQIGETNREKRLLNKENRESRMAILSYLQAEQDRAMTKTIDEFNKEEAEVMKNVPGYKAGQSVYSKRWAPPVIFNK